MPAIALYGEDVAYRDARIAELFSSWRASHPASRYTRLDGSAGLEQALQGSLFSPHAHVLVYDDGSLGPLQVPDSALLLVVTTPARARSWPERVACTYPDRKTARSRVDWLCAFYDADLSGSVRAELSSLATSRPEEVAAYIRSASLVEPALRDSLDIPLDHSRAVYEVSGFLARGELVQALRAAADLPARMVVAHLARVFAAASCSSTCPASLAKYGSMFRAWPTHLAWQECALTLADSSFDALALIARLHRLHLAHTLPARTV